MLYWRFVGPGAPVLVESPTYPNALDSFLAASARLVTVPVSDGWDAELVESSFRQAVPRLAYFTPDFNKAPNNILGDGVNASAQSFNDAFPYLAQPYSGFSRSGGTASSPTGQ